MGYPKEAGYYIYKYGVVRVAEILKPYLGEYSIHTVRSLFLVYEDDKCCISVVTTDADDWKGKIKSFITEEIE